MPKLRRPSARRTRGSSSRTCSEAAAIGALDAARLRPSASLALAVVPVFAATGLRRGRARSPALERVVLGRPAWSPSLVLALPTLAVTIPVCATLFDGAYAQTLPLAQQAP